MYINAFYPLQIADFGMSRDLADTNYYVSHGGKIPVKWTAPEVQLYAAKLILESMLVISCRPSTTRSTPLPVMCGALVVSCMRYGVSDTSHLNSTQTRIASSSLTKEFAFPLLLAVQEQSTSS